MKTGNLDIGKKIKNLRLEKKMGQRALAESIGCSRSMIYLVESGRLSPSLKTFEKIVKGLGARSSDFLGF